MEWPIQENGFLPNGEYTVIFSFGCKSYKQSRCKGRPSTSTPIKHKMPHLESENIRESIIDFTARFGEINPDMPYICDEVSRGSKELFLHLSIRRVIMEE